MLYFQQENLSRRTTTVLTQSSTYDGLTASLANDGILKTDFSSCAHTAPNRTKAWLQVDFGQSFRINNVKIYPRRRGICMVCIDCFKHTRLTFFKMQLHVYCGNMGCQFI